MENQDENGTQAPWGILTKVECGGCDGRGRVKRKKCERCQGLGYKIYDINHPMPKAAKP